MRLGWKGWLAAVVWAGVVGCGGDAEDEGQRQVAEGHHELSPQTLWRDDHPVLISRHLVEGQEPRLHLMPLADPGAACEADRAPERPWLLSVSQEVVQRGSGFFAGATSDAPVWVTEAGIGPRPLRLLEPGCHWANVSLDDVASWAFMFEVTEEGDTHRHVLFARTVTGELWRLDASAGEAERIATGVTHLERRFQSSEAPPGVLTVEGGEIVLRSAQGHEEARYGTSVTSVSSGFGSGQQHVFADAEGVHFMEEEQANPILVEADACLPSLRYPLLFALSPCDERRLVVHDLSRDERHEYMDDVSGVLSFGRPDPELPPEVILATGAQAAASGLLTPLAGPHEAVWLARSPDETILVAEGATLLSPMFPYPVSESVQTDLLLALQGADTWTVARFSVEEGLEVVREGLEDVRRSMGATHVYTSRDENLVDVARLDPDSGDLEPVLTGVPAVPSPRISQHSVLGERASLVYIRDADPETLAGTLEVRHESGEVELIDHGVTSFALPGEWSGLVAYTVVEGNRTGLWVADDVLPAWPLDDLSP
jgi:hypothetical protein